MRSRTKVATVVCATVVCFSVAGLVIYRYRNPDPIPHSARLVKIAGVEQPQPVTREMGPEEAGSFAGAQYLTARQQHLANRDAYLALRTHDAPRDLASARALLVPVLERAFADAGDRAAFSDPRLQSSARDSLVDQIALVLMVASGMECEDYVQLVPVNAQRVVNVDSGPLRYICEQFGFDAAGDPDRLFRQLYDLNESFREGKNNAQRWALGQDGLKAAAAWVKAGDDLNLIFKELDAIPDPLDVDRAYAFWFGMLAQGALVLTQPPVSLAEEFAKADVLVVQAVVIVHSSDDAYPVEMTLWFEGGSGRWWTLAVARRSSIRVGNGPPLIY